ncbi:hypothetical protein AGMMS49531_08920 [Endomicrobiia bacterium]|nr:hypothetical protein AGMMS49531_08920 [Endomicrobiia bacterium]
MQKAESNLKELLEKKQKLGKDLKEMREREEARKSLQKKNQKEEQREKRKKGRGEARENEEDDDEGEEVAAAVLEETVIKLNQEAASHKITLSLAEEELKREDHEIAAIMKDPVQAKEVLKQKKEQDLENGRRKAQELEKKLKSELKALQVLGETLKKERKTVHMMDLSDVQQESSELKKALTLNATSSYVQTVAQLLEVARETQKLEMLEKSTLLLPPP